MIEELLKQLGSTQEEVKDTLIKEDCKGCRQMLCGCPIANYITRKTGILVQVTQRDIYLLKEKQSYEMPLPVIKFIQSFDNGNYPELEL